jgi:hypothetical protein
MDISPCIYVSSLSLPLPRSASSPPTEVTPAHRRGTRWWFHRGTVNLEGYISSRVHRIKSQVFKVDISKGSRASRGEGVNLGMLLVD